MDGIYTKEVLKHFKKPHNMGVIKNPDGIGRAGNVICGDVMQMYIKVKRGKGEKDRIVDIKFQTFGCVAAIATSSVITDLVKGKSIDEALKVTREEVAGSLGGLPKIKMHCSVLAVDALSEAIYDYLMKNRLPVPPELAKRHERIEQESKVVEKKYKDYIALEKKIWKFKEK